MRRLHVQRRTLLLCAMLGPAMWWGCTEDPVSVAEVTLLAKPGGGSPITVDDADPKTAPQGTVALDVHVIGTGFEAGSEVDFLLDGKATNKIITNSTRPGMDFNGTELIANIDIAADAVPDMYDIRVTAGRGRKGIGIEMFGVKITPQQCQVDFDLRMNDDPLNVVRSDNGRLYEHGKDRVLAFVGSGPGFRFDTNGSQKLEARNDRRRVILDFSDAGVTGVPGLPGPNDKKGIDLRFAGTGLNLCDMPSTEESVPVDLTFTDSGDATWGLKYGGTTFRGEACTADEAIVTRMATNEWSVSGATACLVQDGHILYGGDGELDPAPISMLFSFTITAQGAVP